MLHVKKLIKLTFCQVINGEYDNIILSTVKVNLLNTICNGGLLIINGKLSQQKCVRRIGTVLILATANIGNYSVRTKQDRSDSFFICKNIQLLICGSCVEKKLNLF